MTPSAPPQRRIVLIDNIDSFSYNLVDELAQLDYQLVVYRNSVDIDIVLNDLDNFTGEQVVCLSPGPGHPSNAGNLMAVIKHCHQRYPMLGICLGFQALIQFYGGRVARCGEVVHGKTAQMKTQAHPVFNDVSVDGHCVIARYHSLSGYQLPASINVIGRVNEIPMAAEFNNSQALGFQFHPESLLTPNGKQILANSMQFLLLQQSQESSV